MKPHGRVESVYSNAATMTIELLGKLLDAEVIAIVVQDDEGAVSVVPHPGYEREVMRCLRDMDWQTGVRLAEEHCSR